MIHLAYYAWIPTINLTVYITQGHEVAAKRENDHSAYRVMLNYLLNTVLNYKKTKSNKTKLTDINYALDLRVYPN